MEQNYNISVLMTVYSKNTSQEVIASVESIINQTYKPSQIVMVVDGPVSTELRRALIDLENKYFIYKNIWLKSNVGSGLASKEGAKYCKCNYIARMDSDDISMPNRFEKEMSIFRKNKNIDVVGSWCLEFFGDDNKIIGIRKVPEFDKDIKKFMRKRSPFCNMSIIMKKDALINAGGYQDWRWAEDWYLFIRMALKRAVFYNVQESLVKGKVSSSSYERRHGIKYYRSIKGILRYMYDKKLIGYFTYKKECLIRFVSQVLIGKKIESFLYRHMVRSKQ